MIQKNKEIEIQNEYFDWMYHLVCNDKYYSKVSYRKLLSYLDSVDYIPTISMDDNRRIDGINFRNKFGYENGYSYDYINEVLGYKNCSVLEMMVALSFRVEEQLTCNTDYGNRTGQWFWNMIVSLGLNPMTDSKFDINYCDMVIRKFLANDYMPDGRGGLFTFVNPPEDIRDVEIWCQCMWYLNENVYNDDIQF